IGAHPAASGRSRGHEAPGDVQNGAPMEHDAVPADPGDDAHQEIRRPATDFGAPGMVSHFRGPFADGPPAKALHVDTPALERFGYAELKRMIVIGATFLLAVPRALLQKLKRQRKGSWIDATCEGVIDAFEILGPTFVK